MTDEPMNDVEKVALNDRPVLFQRRDRVRSHVVIRKQFLPAQSTAIALGFPISRAGVKIQLQGAHRGDLDNLAGSVLDALVSSGILLDDRITCVPWLTVEYQVKKQQGCWVELLSTVWTPHEREDTP
ncbi:MULTISPECIES: RusA family crossover junction endodeoxyribonuclease [Cyanophyceae]|uniref:RusA family crossover junction endodeoxyribonuclease n=1 Tax=Cyanophyceae TaxID=3028117 RepID=UPI00168888FB|nr:RusA family crossover junction endodeoxyribonuclease [Trichocoleus sp. FACHB-69]MBD1930440.1 RusA family crossover junction endodeoxyribonuclease [Trichocoleus sp. FACHB-69]